MWKLLCLSIFVGSAYARSIELKSQTQVIFIEEIKDWKLGKDLFGIPFVYFSPQLNGQRSNISFTNTGAEVELDVNSLAVTQDQYRENKKKWSSQVGAIIESFLPYETKVNKYGHKIHKIGFSFKQDGKSYLEKSYYIECRGKVLFSKALRLKENEIHDQTFNSLVDNLDCGGV